MWYLIEHLLPYLLLASIAGGVAGWCWHCIRNADRYAGFSLERERLRTELTHLLNQAPQDPQTVTPIKQEHELEALRIRADLSAARVSELEVELKALREAAPLAAMPADESAPLKARIAQLEADLNAARASAEDADALRIRNAELESMRGHVDAAPAEDKAGRWRTRWLESRVSYLEAERETMVAAPVEDAAPLHARIAELEAGMAQRPDSETEANKARWRARYFEARTRYLEDEARAAPAPAAALLATPTKEDAEAANRQRWRARYLEARLSYINAKLEDERTRPRVAPETLVARDDRIAELELELEEAIKQRDANAAHFASLESDLKEADAATRAATDAAAALRAELPPMNARIAELESLIAAARGEHGRQAARIRDLEAELEALRNAPKVDDEEVGRLRWRARYLDNRIAFLEQSLNTVSARTPVAPSPRADEFVPLATSDQGPVRPLGLPAARDGARDDLRVIDGIGPRIESTLNSLGVYHFDQIAAWTPAHVEWVERYLAFKGRIGRERWIEQAQAFARGDGLEARRYLESDSV
jgi:predicted flap endonuclease-1-like 5' DNA nuclease/predicted  nucleic acid-binding Zn-ribbon protein